MTAPHEQCEDEDMAELVFEVTQEADGGYCAECLTLDIFTQADSWDELRANVREAVRAYFIDGGIPERIRLHLVRDEVLPRCEDTPRFERHEIG
jgi:predicted RNase H-like HicB family nuclease